MIRVPLLRQKQCHSRRRLTLPLAKQWHTSRDRAWLFSFIGRSVGPSSGGSSREPSVQGERGQQRGSQHAGVQGEKSRRREVAERRPADRQFVKFAADARQQQQEARPHLGAPVAVLVPSEKVAGEVQGQH